ncbi:NAD(P)-binding protein [Cylindrobasidium torrendii FP15055 ss-10]|uniref:NAD(P)-binding protein n=1 Tax=Cylindrobasidium torrendii FP15055 ss-10 TaxID=1314674 RepID=A0A0D7BUY4_9AGAR|nr:NAD(P)-binding protein [Cylindrobasidium torrendii FP15055 ss-10]
MSSQLVWLITGTSTGFGRELALAALERGERVIATARASSVHKLDDLREKGAAVIELNVTAPIDALKSIAHEAIGIYGQVDVLVNNAGYIQSGTVEETTPEEALAQFNTNVFGALNVARVFLPYMRARKTGTVVWMGSVGGWRGTPAAGLYCSTKWALRGINDSLAMEIEPLGLRSVIFDFGYFRTPFLTSSKWKRQESGKGIEDYRAIAEWTDNALTATNGNQPGDPKKGVRVVLDIVRGEGAASGKAIPRSVLLGSDCFDTVQTEIKKWEETQREWESVSRSTDY